MMLRANGEKKMCIFILTQSTSVTVRHTDNGNSCASIASHGKNISILIVVRTCPRPWPCEPAACCGPRGLRARGKAASCRGKVARV